MSKSVNKYCEDGEDFCGVVPTVLRFEIGAFSSLAFWKIICRSFRVIKLYLYLVKLNKIFVILKAFLIEINAIEIKPDKDG